MTFVDIPKPPWWRRILLRIPILRWLFRYRVRFETLTMPKFELVDYKTDIREIIESNSVKEQ